MPITGSPTTGSPTDKPTISPNSPPTYEPTSAWPTFSPTMPPETPETPKPTPEVTDEPTKKPRTDRPTRSPIQLADDPTKQPTPSPSPWTWPRLNGILEPGDDINDSFFGTSIDIDRSTVVVGVQGDVGSAAVYRHSPDEGVFVQEGDVLEPKDGMTGDDYGRAVAVWKHHAIVGAQKHDADGVVDAGAAYVYERKTNLLGQVEWVEMAKLTTPDPRENERFGISVAIHGRVALVGANGDDTNGENSGAAYIFTLEETSSGEQEWVFAEKLMPSDADVGDSYGFSVSVYENRLAIGAPWDEDRSGSVYMYRLVNGEWVEEGKLRADTGAPQDQFGWSVDLYEDTIAVGAFTHDARGTDSGAAYVFSNDDRGVWAEEARLVPSDGDANDHYGRSVSLHGHWLIVGAPFDDDAGLEAGAAYIYQRTDDPLDTDGIWTLKKKQLPTVDPTEMNEFGFGVGASRDFLVVSSKHSGTNNEGDAFGNVYVYETYEPGAPTASPTDEIVPTDRPTSPPETADPTPAPVSDEPTPSPVTSKPTPTPVATIVTSEPSPGGTTASPEATSTTTSATTTVAQTTQAAQTTVAATEWPTWSPSNAAAGTSAPVAAGGTPTESPTPFDSARGTLNPSSPPSGLGEGTPPPTPFGATAAPVSSAPSIGGAPSVQTDAPTPFGAGGGTTSTPSIAVNGTDAPTPFGAGGGTSSPVSSTSSAPSMAAVGTTSPVAGTTTPPAPPSVNVGELTWSPTSAPPTVMNTTDGGGTTRSCPDTLTESAEIDSSATLYYAMVPSDPAGSDNGLLCARLEVAEDGWVGFAISEEGLMSGSTAIIGVPDEGSVLKYALSGENGALGPDGSPNPMPDDQQTLMNASVGRKDGTVIMEFTKLLVEDSEVPIMESGANTFLHARGGSALGYHIARMAFELDFSS